MQKMSRIPARTYQSTPTILLVFVSGLDALSVCTQTLGEVPQGSFSETYINIEQETTKKSDLSTQWKGASAKGLPVGAQTFACQV